MRLSESVLVQSLGEDGVVVLNESTGDEVVVPLDGLPQLLMWLQQIASGYAWSLNDDGGVTVVRLR